ncbi:hypothetical protein WA026_011471 [Henosepilachna vigintioctopunctata]|uniref:Uncharacterized protein n=1 Tax=Henosepilachna vigintioctopunctata TaxID=420089 RepID=A0AAW1TTR3_9CUCU
MPTFVRCFSEIQADIESIHDKLAYYEWAPFDDKFLKRRPLHSPIDSVVSSKSLKSISEARKSQSKLHENKPKKNEKQRNAPKNTPVVKSRNYVHILYPTVPEPENNFLSKLHYRIFYSFWNIQEMAKVFYDKHEEITNKYLIFPEYKSFIEEILAKYKYYQLQLEFVWLECIAEFIKLVTNYQKYLDDYYKDTLIKYFEVRKAQLRKIYDETIKNLEENIKSIEEYYMNAHGKLKTMFGHPNMSNMLTTIEQYISKADSFAKKILLNNLMPCKENIKDHCASTESTFLDLEQILSCIKGSTRSISLKNDLENQLLEKTEKMQKILSLTDEPVDEEVDDYHIAENVAKKLKFYKNKAQIPPEVEISYTNIIKSRSASESSIRLLDTELLLKENYGDYEMYCEKVDSFQEKCNAIHQKYKTIWKQDIERIIKLFQVKYNYSTIE